MAIQLAEMTALADFGHPRAAGAQCAFETQNRMRLTSKQRIKQLVLRQECVMERVPRFVFAVTLAAFMLPLVLLAQTADYDKVISQAKADLAAGHNADALAGSQKAIQMDASRWQAYLVAGSALQNQKQFDLAVDNYSKAIERAPEAKKIGVRNVLEQCMREKLSAPSSPAALAPAATAEGATFKETLDWLISKNAQEGYTYTAVSYLPDGGNTDPDTTQQRNPFAPSADGAQCTAAIGGSAIDFSKSTPNSAGVKAFDVHKVWGMTSSNGIVTRITSAQDTYFVITGVWPGISFEQSLAVAPIYSDQDLAKRVAKALNHAVDVCGGKGKAEAF
jgi:hypothetical protein